MNRKQVWIGIAVLVTVCLLVSTASADKVKTTLKEGSVSLGISEYNSTDVPYGNFYYRLMQLRIEKDLRHQVYDQYVIEKAIMGNKTGVPWTSTPDILVQPVHLWDAWDVDRGTGTLVVYRGSYIGILNGKHAGYVDLVLSLSIDHTWQKSIGADKTLSMSGGAEKTSSFTYLKDWYNYGGSGPERFYVGNTETTGQSCSDISTDLGIGFCAEGWVITSDVSNGHTVSIRREFYNEYEVSLIDWDGTTYKEINITRAGSGCADKYTKSKFIIYDEDGGVIHESTFKEDVNETSDFGVVPVAIFLTADDMGANHTEVDTLIYYDTILGFLYCSVKGYTYNAETGAILTNVSVDMDGRADESDENGLYFISPLLAEREYTLTGSKTGYFDWGADVYLPFGQEYLIDLPLIPIHPTHIGHGILGTVRTLPYYGICENQGVRIENATWSDTTTTNNRGYYMFDDLEVGDYWINVSKDTYRDNNQSVTVSATGDETETIDNCDATTNWSSDNSLTLNTTDKQEGTGSLQSSGSSAMDFNKSAPTAIDASNVTKSNGYMTFWYKINDTTRITDYLVFTVGSNGDNSTHKISWSVYKSNFVNDTWKEVWLKFSDGTETGTLNMSDIDWLEVKAAKSNSAISKIDNIRFYDFSYEIHDVDLDPILNLGVIAKTLNEETIAEFTAILEGDSLNTTFGEELIFTNLSYGMKELTVTSEGYFPYQRSIYLDSNTNITAYMQEGAEGGAGVYYPPPPLVEFRVQNMWGKAYSNALVTASGYSTTMGGGTFDWFYSIFGFKNETQIHNATMSDTTDSNGHLSFLMVATVKYQINVSDTESPARFDNKTFWIYPKDERYNLVVSNGITWQKAGTEEQKEMSINVTTLIINSSCAYLNVSYNDPSNQTTDLTICVNQTINNNEEDCLNSSNWVDTSVQNYSYIVTPYKGRAYKIQVVTEHEEWGSRTWTYAKRFEGMLIDLNLPDSVYPMIAVAILIFMGGIFGRSSATQGSLVICFGGWFFWAIGFFAIVDSVVFLSALSLASVVSIIAIMMEKSRKTGVQ